MNINVLPPSHVDVKSFEPSDLFELVLGPKGEHLESASVGCRASIFLPHSEYSARSHPRHGLRSSEPRPPGGDI